MILSNSAAGESVSQASGAGLFEVSGSQFSVKVDLQLRVQALVYTTQTKQLLDLR